MPEACVHSACPSLRVLSQHTAHTLFSACSSLCHTSLQHRRRSDTHACTHTQICCPSQVCAFFPPTNVSTRHYFSARFLFFFPFLVSVHWQLHFKFLMSRVSPSEMLKSSVVSGLSGCKAIQWQGLQTVAMETLIWDLPVTILPTIPMQLDQSKSTVHTLDL